MRSLYNRASEATGCTTIKLKPSIYTNTTVTSLGPYLYLFHIKKCYGHHVATDTVFPEADWHQQEPFEVGQVLRLQELSTICRIDYTAIQQTEGSTCSHFEPTASHNYRPTMHLKSTPVTKERSNVYQLTSL